MADNDLDILKAIVDRTAINAEPDGRFDEAEAAISNVLRVLFETPSGKEMWQPIYVAIRSAYVSDADWGDDD